MTSLIDSAWTIAVGAYPRRLLEISPGTLWGWVIIALGMVLLVSSLVSLLGLSRAFYTSAALSLVSGLALVLTDLVVDGIFMPATFSSDLPIVVTLLLTALSSILCMVGARRRREHISERNHPLNLPVFG